MSQSSAGFNDVDDEDVLIADADAMPLNPEDRASTSLISPKSQLPEQDEMPSAPVTRAMVQPGDDLGDNREDIVSNVIARPQDYVQPMRTSLPPSALDALSGAEKLIRGEGMEDEEALALQESGIVPQAPRSRRMTRRGSRGGIPMYGDSLVWLDSFARNVERWREEVAIAQEESQRGYNRYLKSLGAEFDVLPDGGEVLRQHDDGSISFKPGWVGGLKQDADSGRFYRAWRDDRGTLVARWADEDDRLHSIDPSTGDKYVTLPDGGRAVVGRDEWTAALSQARIARDRARAEADNLLLDASRLRETNAGVLRDAERIRSDDRWRNYTRQMEVVSNALAFNPTSKPLQERVAWLQSQIDKDFPGYRDIFKQAEAVESEIKSREERAGGLRRIASAIASNARYLDAVRHISPDAADRLRDVVRGVEPGDDQPGVEASVAATIARDPGKTRARATLEVLGDMQSRGVQSISNIPIEQHIAYAEQVDAMVESLGKPTPFELGYSPAEIAKLFGKPPSLAWDEEREKTRAVIEMVAPGMRDFDAFLSDARWREMSRQSKYQKIFEDAKKAQEVADYERDYVNVGFWRAWWQEATGRGALRDKLDDEVGLMEAWGQELQAEIQSAVWGAGKGFTSILTGIAATGSLMFGKGPIADRFGVVLARGVDEWFSGNQARKDTLGGFVGELIGNGVSFLLPIGLVGAATRGVGMSYKGVVASSRIAAGLIGAAAEAGQSILESERMGLSDEETWRRALVAAGAGSTEAFGLPTALIKVDRMLGGSVKRILTSAGLEVLEEGGQEVGAALIRGGYDLSKGYKNWEEVKQEVLAGGGGGAFMGFLFSAFLGASVNATMRRRLMDLRKTAKVDGGYGFIYANGVELRSQEKAYRDNGEIAQAEGIAEFAAQNDAVLAEAAREFVALPQDVYAKIAESDQSGVFAGASPASGDDGLNIFAHIAIGRQIRSNQTKVFQALQASIRRSEGGGDHVDVSAMVPEHWAAIDRIAEEVERSQKGAGERVRMEALRIAGRNFARETLVRAINGESLDGGKMEMLAELGLVDQGKSGALQVSADAIPLLPAGLRIYYEDTTDPQEQARREAWRAKHAIVGESDGRVITTLQQMGMGLVKSASDRATGRNQDAKTKRPHEAIAATSKASVAVGAGRDLVGAGTYRITPVDVDGKPGKPIEFQAMSFEDARRIAKSGGIITPKGLSIGADEIARIEEVAPPSIASGENTAAAEEEEPAVASDDGKSHPKSRYLQLLADSGVNPDDADAAIARTGVDGVLRIADNLGVVLRIGDRMEYNSNEIILDKVQMADTLRKDGAAAMVRMVVEELLHAAADKAGFMAPEIYDALPNAVKAHVQAVYASTRRNKFQGRGEFVRMWLENRINIEVIDADTVRFVTGDGVINETVRSKSLGQRIAEAAKRFMELLKSLRAALMGTGMDAAEVEAIMSRLDEVEARVVEVLKAGGAEVVKQEQQDNDKEARSVEQADQDKDADRKDDSRTGGSLSGGPLAGKVDERMRWVASSPNTRDGSVRQVELELDVVDLSSPDVITSNGTSLQPRMRTDSGQAGRASNNLNEMRILKKWRPEQSLPSSSFTDGPILAVEPTSEARAIEGQKDAKLQVVVGHGRRSVKLRMYLDPEYAELAEKDRAFMVDALEKAGRPDLADKARTANVPAFVGRVVDLGFYKSRPGGLLEFSRDSNPGEMSQAERAISNAAMLRYYPQIAENIKYDDDGNFLNDAESDQAVALAAEVLGLFDQATRTGQLSDDVRNEIADALFAYALHVDTPAGRKGSLPEVFTMLVEDGRKLGMLRLKGTLMRHAAKMIHAEERTGVVSRLIAPLIKRKIEMRNDPARRKSTLWDDITQQGLGLENITEDKLEISTRNQHALVDALDGKGSLEKALENVIDDSLYGNGGLFSQRGRDKDDSAQLHLDFEGRPQPSKSSVADLVQSNMGLALWWTNKFKLTTTGVEVDDILQEARVALVRAAQSYVNHGEFARPFASYASTTIFNRLARLYHKSSRIRSHETTSLDAEIGGEEGEGGSLYDILDSGQAASDSVVISDELRNAVAAAISKLPARLKDVVEGRMGGQSMEEIANVLGVSKQAVSMMQKRAFKMLRSSLRPYAERYDDITTGKPIDAQKSSEMTLEAARRVHRKLTRMIANGQTLNAGQSKAYMRAEDVLGQSRMFDDLVSVSKPAVSTDITGRVDITPEMRESIRAKGQPLFSQKPQRSIYGRENIARVTDALKKYFKGNVPDWVRVVYEERAGMVEDARHSSAGERSNLPQFMADLPATAKAMVAATKQEIKRFNELTAELQAKPKLTQADLDAWKQANPEAYAELEKMREAVLRRGGWIQKVFRGTVNKNEAIPPTSFEAGAGIFTTDNPDVAEIFRYKREYGEVITEQFNEDTGEYESIEGGDLQTLFVKLNNPLILNDETTPNAQDVVMDTGLQSRMLKEAIQKGYDGVILENVEEGVGEWMEDGTTYIVFDPRQLKSADPLNLENGKLITPDKWAEIENPDIRYSRAKTTAIGEIPQWQAARDPGRLSEKVNEARRIINEARSHLENILQAEEGKKRQWESKHGSALEIGSSGSQYSGHHIAYVVSKQEPRQYEARRIETWSAVDWEDKRNSELRRERLSAGCKVVPSSHHGLVYVIEPLQELLARARARFGKISKFIVSRPVTLYLTSWDSDVGIAEVILENGNPVAIADGVDYKPFTESKEVAIARDRLAQAEADLYLAMEEEGGRSERLADKESAAEWARRTKAAEFAALLDARDEKTRRLAGDFVAQMWEAYAQHDEIFQYGRTTSKSADEIAKAVSVPGKPVTATDRGEYIIFDGKEGHITIYDADTDRPYIQSTAANSMGKLDGGGSQLYAAGLDWIHNNGKRIKDDSGLTPINYTRRTSNFLASALRWGTTKHLEPHKNQDVRWTQSDMHNLVALAVKEMDHAFKAIPDAKQWEYEFATGRFRDDAGNDLTRERLESAVQLGNPRKSGIGMATLQRAIITHSAIRAFERGETAQGVLDAAQRRIVPFGVVYSAADSLWDARLIDGVVELNAAVLAPEDVPFKVEHEIGHRLWADGDLGEAFDTLWGALSPEQRAGIEDTVGRLYRDVSGSTQLEETRVRALEEIRRMVAASAPQSALARAWKAFIEAVSKAWSRLTGRLPKDPETLAARMVEIGVRRMTSPTDAAKIEAYFHSRGAPRTSEVREASVRLSRVLSRKGGTDEGIKYVQGELFDNLETKSIGQEVAQIGSRAAAMSRKKQNISPDLRAGLTGDWGALKRELDAKGRASAILSDLIDGRIPSWDITGTVIESPQDVFAAMLPIRTPYFETLKVMVLDNKQRVAWSQIVHVGGLDTSVADPRRIFAVLTRLRERTGKNYRDIIVSHNHPSGDPSPSHADRKTQNMLNQVANETGWRVIDHVITNGRKFYSFRMAGEMLAENDEAVQRYVALNKSVAGNLADWEVVSVDDLVQVDDYDSVANIVRHLRNAADEVGHLIWLNTQLRMTAIERFDVKEFLDVNTKKFHSRIASGGAREGARGFILEIPGGTNAMSLTVYRQMRDLQRYASYLSLDMCDLVSVGDNDVFSARNQGSLSVYATSYFHEPHGEIAQRGAKEDTKINFEQGEQKTHVKIEIADKAAQEIVESGKLHEGHNTSPDIVRVVEKRLQRSNAVREEERKMMRLRRGGSGLATQRGGDRLEQMFARAEEEERKGAKLTIGDWTLAHGADNPLRRAVDEIYREDQERQSVESWDQKAREILISALSGKDGYTYEQLIDRLVDRATTGEPVSAVEVRLAKMVVSRETQAGAVKTAEGRRMLASLMSAQRWMGAETARAMRARVDENMTPQERWRVFAAENLLNIQPPPRFRRMIDAAPSEAQKDARIAQLERELEEARKQGRAAQEAAAQAALNAAKQVETKESLAKQWDEKAVAPLIAKLASWGVTPEDVLGGRVELSLIGSRFVSDIYNSLDNQTDKNIMYYMQAKRGGDTLERVAVRIGISVDELKKRYNAIYQRLLKTYLEKTKKGVTVASLKMESMQDIGKALRAQNMSEHQGGEISDEKALAEAITMMRESGFFSIEEYNIRKVSRRPRKGGKARQIKLIDEAEVKRLPDAPYSWGDRFAGEKSYVKPENPEMLNIRILDAQDEWVYESYVVDPESVTDRLHMIRLAQTAMGGNWLDYVTEIGVANLLSAPITLATNLTGYTYGAYELMFKRGIEALWSKIARRGGSNATLAEYMPMLKALPRALSLAWQNSRIAWDTESGIFNRALLDHDPGSLFENFSDLEHIKVYVPDQVKIGKLKVGTPGGRDLLSAMLAAARGRPWQGVSVGRTIRTPYKAMLAVDDFMRSLLGVVHAAGLAHRMGRSRGLKGDELRGFIEGQLSMRGSEAYYAAAEEALKWAFMKPLRTMAQQKETGNANLLEAGVKALQDLKTTDTRDMNAIQQIGVLILRMTFPFVRTPYRLFEAGWSMTLLGSAYDAWKKHHGRKITLPGGESQRLAFSQEAKVSSEAGLISSVGLFAMILMAAEGDEDDDEKPILITGSMAGSVLNTRGDADGDVSAAARAHAYRTVPPYTIRFGGEGGLQIDYRRYDPLSTVLATTVDAIREFKAAMRGAGWERVAGNVAKSIYDQFADKASLRGFGELDKLLRGEHGILEHIVRQGAAYTVPNLLRNPARNIDAVVRDTRTEPLSLASIQESFVPGPWSKAPARVGPDGAPMLKTGNWFTRVFVPGNPSLGRKYSEVDAFWRRYNLSNPGRRRGPAIPPAVFTRDGERVVLSAREYNEEFLPMWASMLFANFAADGLLDVRSPSDYDADLASAATARATREARDVFLAGRKR